MGAAADSRRESLRIYMSPRYESSSNWQLFGDATAPVSPVSLRAGPLRLLYEPACGFLRRICLGEHEVLRGIYAAVRDHNWGTIPGLVKENRRELGEKSFLIEFQNEHNSREVNFVWRGTIRGEVDGTIQYEFDGEARSTFRRNRIGFCVLHPIRECAGANARQTRVDGRVIASRFPVIIEPQIFGKSSFRDLRAVAHEFAPGLWAEVEFEGDVFEMEDQRNWTDASFKTYCTPLALPFPVQIHAGTRIQQKVTLRLLQTSTQTNVGVVEVSHPEPDVVTISMAESRSLPFPRLGLGMTSIGTALTVAEIARIRALNLSHLRVDVRLASPDWQAVWTRATHEARQIGCDLEVALHLPSAGSGNLAAWRHCLQTDPPELSRVLALREGEIATTRETLKLIRHALAGLPLPIGAGSDANFCELNREQALGNLALDEADFLFWSMNPQVHACDPLSIMETLEAQADTLHTARTFARGKPLVITPVTLKPRFNAVATSQATAAAPDELPQNVDPRQLSQFLASWTLGSVEALSTSGAESITLFETVGWRGVMESEQGSLLPDIFPSEPGGTFLVYHLLAGLASVNGITPAGNSDPSRITALPCDLTHGGRRIALGNLTAQVQRIHLLGANSAILGQGLATGSVSDSGAFLLQPGKRLTPQQGIIALSLPPNGCVFLDEKIH